MSYVITKESLSRKRCIQLLIETMSKISNNSILSIAIATYNFEQALSMKVNMFSRSVQKFMNILHQAKTTSNGRTAVTN